MKIKNKLLVIMLITFLGITLVGCGFNEDKAKTDSKQQLESFLRLYKNKQILVNSTDKSKVKKFVDNKFKNYFTTNFINDTNNAIDNNSKYENSFNYKETFYLISNDNKTNTEFFNDFKINSPTINKQNETVKYLIEGNDFSTKGYVNVTMREENGKWKIDKAD